MEGIKELITVQRDLKVRYEIPSESDGISHNMIV